MIGRLSIVSPGASIAVLLLAALHARASSSDATLALPTVADTPNTRGGDDAIVVDHEQQLLGTGYDLRKQGKDSDALAVYRQAYALRHDTKPLAQIALALEALGQWSQAYPVLQQALSDRQHPWIQSNRVLLEAELARIDQHLGRLFLVIPLAGAGVQINGAPPTLARDDQPLLLNPGWNVVEVELAGYATYRREIEIEAGKQYREIVRLTRRISPRAWSENQDADLVQPIHSRNSVTHPQPNRLWLAGAIGGVLIAAVAIIPWSIANGKVDRLEQDCAVNPRCSFGATSNDVQRLDRVTNALLLSGLGIAATSTVLYLTLPQTVPASGTAVTAWANHNGAGLLYHASY